MRPPPAHLRCRVSVSGRDIDLSYTAIGAGPPTLVLSGWGHSARVWAGVAARAQGTKLIIPDLPGYGRTPPLKREFRSLAVYADLALAFARATAGSGFVGAIGHSMGGLLLHAIWARDPALFPCAAVVGAPYYGVRWLKPVVSTPLLTAVILHAYAAVPRQWAGALEAAAMKLGLRRLERITRLVIEEMQRAHVSTSVSLLREIVRYGHRGLFELAPAPGPLLVGRGEVDTLLEANEFAAAAELLKPARIVTFTNVGHAVNVSAPHRFAAAVIPFLLGKHEAGATERITA